MRAIAVYVVEFIGPFALTFIGAGAIILDQVLHRDATDLVSIALAHGLAIGLMVAAAGHISGGHYNPAVTIGLLATRRIKPAVAAGYIVAQLLGALVAAALLKAFFPADAVNTVQLGTPALGRGVDPVAGTIIEVILTFFLMFTIFGTAVDTRGPRGVAPLAIGLTISMDILAGGPLTGAAMNPSRWFGTAIVQGFLDNWWVYWVGPIIGALIAALLYHYVLLDERQRTPAA
jgi:aquaporin Z